MTYRESKYTMYSSVEERHVQTINPIKNENDYCCRCSDYIYPLELMGQIMGNKYHRQCFKCLDCARHLDLKTYYTNTIDLNDRNIYCVAHAPRNGKSSVTYYVSNHRANSPALNHREFNRSRENLESLSRSRENLESLSRSRENLDNFNSVKYNVVVSPTFSDNSSSLNKSQSSINELGWNRNLDQEEKHKSYSRSNTQDSINSSSRLDESSRVGFKDTTIEYSSNSYNFKGSSSNLPGRELPTTIITTNGTSGLNNNSSLSKGSATNIVTIVSPNLSNNRRGSNAELLNESSQSNYRGSSSNLINSSSQSTYKGSSSDLTNISGAHNRGSSIDLINITGHNRGNSLDYVDTSSSSRNNRASEFINNNASSSSLNNNYRGSSSNLNGSNIIVNTLIDSVAATSGASDSRNHVNFKTDSRRGSTTDLSGRDIIVEKVAENIAERVRLENPSTSRTEFFLPATPSGNTTIIGNHSISTQESHSQSTYHHHKEIHTTENKYIIGVPVLPYEHTINQDIRPSNRISHDSESNQSYVSVIIPSVSDGSNRISRPSSPSVQIPVEYSNRGGSNQVIHTVPVIPDQKRNESPVIVVPQPVSPKPISDFRPVEPAVLGENKNYGMIKLTVFYDELRSRLSVTVHEAQNLKNLDKKGLSDAKARVYLLPDDKQHTFKRKTKVIKDNLNPKWEETFDYTMTFAEASSKDLIVNLKDDKGLFQKQDTVFLGEVVLKLKNIDIKTPYTRWFYLQQLNSVSKLLLNSGIRPYS